MTCIAPWVFPDGSREPYFESVAWSSPGAWSAACWRPRPAKAPARRCSRLSDCARAPRTSSTPLPQTCGRIEWRNPAHFTDTDIDAIVTGDLLVVKNGERVPTDGVIVAGEARIDESMITGESKPVSKTAATR